MNRPPPLDEFRTFFLRDLERVSSEVEDSDRLPDASFQRLAEMGALRLTHPREHGGFGLSFCDYMPYLEVAGMGPAAGRMVVHVANGLWRPLIAFGDDRQKALAEGVGKGAAVVALAITEPEGTGKDLTTRARRDGSSYFIDGEKWLITFAESATTFLVLALADDGAPTMFVIDAEHAGLSVTAQPRMGLAGIGLGQVRLASVDVEESAILGDVGDGFKVAAAFLDASRVSLACCMVGLAQRALDETTAFVRARTTFGKPLSDRQAIQVAVARMHTQVVAARALVSSVARAVDAGGDYALEAATAKLFCSEMVCSVTEEALRLQGGRGYLRQSAVQRLHRDARSFWSEEGTSEVQQLLIARRLLS